MIHNLGEVNSLIQLYTAQLRDAQVQQDSLRFRKNMERLGACMAYEISKTFDYEERETETSLGTAITHHPTDRVVLATILRAGLPLHQGMLDMIDHAGSAFISAYRKHHKDGSFEIKLEYMSCPDLEGTTLIVCDPMIATGASIVLALRELLKSGTPKTVHLATAIAAVQGVEHTERMFPSAHIWLADLDEELTAKSYIVPGLGDAGDLSFGPKVQE